MKSKSEWLSLGANVASIISAVGGGIGWVLHKQPMLSGIAFGAGVGYSLGRRMADAEHARMAKPDARTAVLEAARPIADRLTREPWDEFPDWTWTIANSRQALAVAMDRVAERVPPGSSPEEIEGLVRESVRMHIKDVLGAQARTQAQIARINRSRSEWMRGPRR